MMNVEMRLHAVNKLLPFWKALRDDKRGGYIGLVGQDLSPVPDAPKGIILNSRILWFFSACARVLKTPDSICYARHAYDFMTKYAFDPVHGGVYWMLSCDGAPLDDTKHAYNQAFAIYALSEFYEASGDKQTLEKANALFALVEDKCRNGDGYGEAYTRDFSPDSNDKLSDNKQLMARGVTASRTMNTLLHLLEAYTALYRAGHDARVGQRLASIVEIMLGKVCSKENRRLEVFFDDAYNSLADVHSYGHDIEASWLMDRACEALQNDALTARVHDVTGMLAQSVLEAGFDGDCVYNERDALEVDKTRVWWVQAEAVIGFSNAYQKTGDKRYQDAAERVWRYIKEHVIDRRDGGEWFAMLDESDAPVPGIPEADPWKCPYHNGRMCLEIIQRGL